MLPNTDHLLSLSPVAPTRRTVAIARWATTGLFCTLMVASGLSFLAGAPAVVTMLHHLGYPDYFRLLLAGAKLLGVAALLAPNLHAIRGWAYAGFTFLFVAAICSHLLSGDGFAHAVPAILMLGLSLASYSLRRPMAERNGQ